jgi:hypothetical protein
MKAAITLVTNKTAALKAMLLAESEFPSMKLLAKAQIIIEMNIEM